MNVEDPNVYMSRFSQEAWEGFVMARKPTQIVCNLRQLTHEKMELPCLEVDVKSCRLNGITEGNAHDIPVYSPLDEFKTLGVAFKAYHALRFGHREVVVKAIRTGNFDHVHSLLLDYLWCSASELSLRHYAS